jgi:hypothetical protein
MSKMLIVSPEFHSSQEILTVVAMLSGRCRLQIFLMGLLLFLSSQRLATTKPSAESSRRFKAAVDGSLWGPSNSSKCIQRIQK